MKYRIRKYHPAVMLIILMVATSLACSLPFLIQNRDRVEVSEEAANSFEETLEETAKDLKETGVLELTITETEITSYIDVQLKQQPEPIFTNPQVYFVENGIELTGDVTQGGLKLPLKASLSVRADGTGGIDYRVNSASVGPMQLPAGMLNQMTEQVENAFGNNISGKIPNLYIENITISDGIMMIQGYSR